VPRVRAAPAGERVPGSPYLGARFKCEYLVVRGRQPWLRWVTSSQRRGDGAPVRAWSPRRRLGPGGHVGCVGPTCAILRQVREPHAQAGYCV